MRGGVREDCRQRIRIKVRSSSRRRIRGEEDPDDKVENR